MLGRLVEKSLVSFDDRGPDRRYRLLETVRLYASGELDGLRGDAGARGRGTPTGRSRSPRRRSTRSSSTARRRTCARRSTPFSPRDSGGALRLCAALTPFWLRRIDLVEAQRRFAAALAGSPEPTALRAEALLAASAIDFRAGLTDSLNARVEESLEIAVSRRRSRDRMAWRSSASRTSPSPGTTARPH